MSKNVFENKISAALLAVLCCFLWGSAFPAIKLVYTQLSMESQLQRIQFGGIRFMIAGIMVFLYAMVTNKKNIRKVFPDKKTIKPILYVAFLQSFAAYSLYYIGMGNTTGVKGSILVSSGIFFVLLFSHFAFKDDKFNRYKVAGLILGFAGILIINLKSGVDISWDFKFMGEGFIILNCIIAAVSTIVVKKTSSTINAVQLNTWQLIFGGFALFLFGLSGSTLLKFNLLSGLLTLYMAFLSAAAFTLWFTLIKYNKAGEITIYKFTVPIFGSTMAALLVPGESFSYTIVIGLILAVLGIFVVYYKDMKKNNNTAGNSKTADKTASLGKQ